MAGSFWVLLRRTAIGGSVALLLVGAASAAPAQPMTDAATLRVTDMTFVSSRGDIREVVLRSRAGVFRTEERRAELADVSVAVNEIEHGRSFSMTCKRAELDIDTNDFLAEGDVRGETGDGQRYAAPWVRYQHEQGVLFTDAPVQMEDATGSFRGDGFRYHVRERRFELLGNVRVEQRP